jgi:hypothetical protein
MVEGGVDELKDMGESPGRGVIRLGDRVGLLTARIGLDDLGFFFIYLPILTDANAPFRQVYENELVDSSDEDDVAPLNGAEGDYDSHPRSPRRRSSSPLEIRHETISAAEVQARVREMARENSRKDEEARARREVGLWHAVCSWSFVGTYGLIAPTSARPTPRCNYIRSCRKRRERRR